MSIQESVNVGSGLSDVTSLLDSVCHGGYADICRRGLNIASTIDVAPLNKKTTYMLVMLNEEGVLTVLILVSRIIIREKEIHLLAR